MRSFVFVVLLLMIATVCSSSPPTALIRELHNHTAVDVVAQAMSSIAESIAAMTNIVEKEYSLHRPEHKPHGLSALLKPKPPR